MSGIRQFTRRRQAHNNLKKTKAKVTILDGILVLGLTLTLLGLLWRAFSYFYYTGGRPEGIINSRYEGTIHVEHEEPSQPYYRDLSKYSPILTVIGLAISGLSIAVKYARKKIDSDSR
jgi:uncharacterized membrane protein